MEHGTTSRFFLAFFATMFWGMGVRGLHDLEIRVPGAVLVGETVTLECSWRLDDEEALYSVKWYRGREEFYRYIPKELPHTRVFPLPGVEVDISRSGARRVVLQQATPALAGRFRCEVSADAPTFHTEIRSAPLLVVEPPAQGPRLVSERSWYGGGALLRAACAAPPAHPPANLTLALNGREVEVSSFGHVVPEWFSWEPAARADPAATSTARPGPAEDPARVSPDDAAEGLQYLDEEYVDTHRDDIRRPPPPLPPPPTPRHSPDQRKPSFAEVQFEVRPESFEQGALRLTCVASIYNLYSARAHLLFDMEQPEVASVLGVRNSAGPSCLHVWRLSAPLLTLLTLLYSVR